MPARVYDEGTMPANPLRLSTDILEETSLDDARDTSRLMERFLASVEQRGYRFALLQLGDRDDALDAVQDAMFKLVRKYAQRSAAEWTPLFWTILRSRITDQQRRRAFRNRFKAWLGTGFGGERDVEPSMDPQHERLLLACRQRPHRGFDRGQRGAPEPSVVLEQRAAAAGR